MEQINKFQQFKKPLIYGGIFLTLVILLEIIILSTCKEELYCVGLAFVITLPGMLFRISPGTTIEIIFDVIFYFLLGALIGFLVQKFKK